MVTGPFLAPVCSCLASFGQWNSRRSTTHWKAARAPSRLEISSSQPYSRSALPSTNRAMASRAASEALGLPCLPRFGFFTPFRNAPEFSIWVTPSELVKKIVYHQYTEQWFQVNLGAPHTFYEHVFSISQFSGSRTKSIARS